MSLVKKLLLWFGAGVTAMLLLLWATVSTQLGGNTDKSITGSMEEMKNYCSIAIMRAISEEGYDADEQGFSRAATDIAGDINLMLGNGIACYDMQGSVICSTFDTAAADREGAEDLQYAMRGEGAYTVVKGKESMYVYFSFPLELYSENIGIIRIQADYSNLNNNNTYVKTSLMISTAGMLIVLGIILTVFMTNVVSPVKKLSEEIERMTVRPETAHPLPVNRKDEIGRLTDLFNRLTETLRSQMGALRSERDRLTGTLAYKKAFYDNLTHELKTPITIIRGYAEMMRDTELEDREFAKKGTEQIITESRRLGDMVAALLENSRSENRQRQSCDVDLVEMISGVVAAMSIKAQRYGSSIDTKLCEAHVKGDPERLRQLFVNLIDNAIKYGRTAGTVRVIMETDESSSIICVYNETEQSSVFEQSDKIFLPFYRSRGSEKKEEGSVGLGLSICKSVAEEHGGSISASKTGEEVCLRVVLPLSGRLS